MAVHRLRHIDPERNRQVMPPAATPTMLLTRDSDQPAPIHRYIEIVFVVQPLLDLVPAYPLRPAVITMDINLYAGIARSLANDGDIPAGRLGIHFFHSVARKGFLQERFTAILRLDSQH